MSGSEEYRKAGVDTAEGRNFASLISAIAKSTHKSNVVSTKSGYGGILDVSALKDYKNPVIVTTTDGVGTKLTLARLFDRHDGVGIDLVAMCSNDILATGAKPLAFLDYIACGKLSTERMIKIGESIGEGCRRADCSLVGGETAEHPGVMEEDDYDLAGFMVGVHEKDSVIDGQNVQEGDILIGLPSSGVHSNGISLVRRLFLKKGNELPDSQEDRDFLLNEILLKPTVIYEKTLRPLLDSDTPVHGIVHITGGGFEENLPRILPDGLSAVIEKGSFIIPDVFNRIKERGKMDDQELFSVFNMGIGMVVVVPRERSADALQILQSGTGNLLPETEGKISIIGRIEKTSDHGQVIFS